MESLPTFREPRYTVLVLLVLAVAGLSALMTMGRQEDPTITNIFASITTLLPGAEAARVESLITTEIENKLQEISEIATIDSVSFRGGSVVNAQIDEAIDPDRIEEIWVEMRNAVADARINFPEDAQEPEINTEGISAYSTVLAVSANRPGISTTSMFSYAEVIADRIRRVPKTRLVDFTGEPQEEVLVSIDPYAAGRAGVTVDEIAQRIAGADGKVVAGRLVSGDIDTNLAISGEITQLDRVRAVPLRESGDGQVLRVEDVATVSRGPRLPAESLALANGEPAILISALAEEGVQIDRWMGHVREEIAQAVDEAPRGMNVSILFDQSVYTIDRLTQVGLNMALGMAIVIAVLVVTLGWRAAAIVALILPMVSLATLATLKIIGLPLHQMTVSGLIVSLGLVVDAAIVMTDTVRRKLADGMSRDAAVTASVKRLLMPLGASTFTTMLSFMPMIILPGPTGDFVSAIAIAVTVMLFWSFLLAILVTSALSGRLLSQRPADVAPRRSLLARPAEWIMKLIVHNPIGSLGVSLILPILGFALAGTLTPQFFPAEDRNQFHIEVDLPGHTVIGRTADLAKRIDAALRDVDGITSTYWGIGASAPSFYYNVIGGSSNAPDFAQAMVTTEDSETTRRILSTLQDDLDAQFPEARIIVRRLVQGPPVGAPVEFWIVGPDLQELRRLGEALQTIVAQQEEITQVRSVINLGRPQVRYDIDTIQANRLGIDEGDIARQLEAGLSGTFGSSLVEGTDQIPIRLRFDASVRQTADRISDLPLVLPAGPDGPRVAVLSSIARPRLETSDAAIFRKDGERMNVLQGFIKPEALPENALNKALAAIEASDVVLPAGYRLELGGDTDERGDAVRNLLSSVGLIVTLVLATSVLTFRSFRLTIGAVIVAVLSAGLSLLSLVIMQFPFGLNALIGMIGSIGVSINAAIIIFTALQENEDAVCGDRDAGAMEVLGASRHIISTTVTTFGGFLPLILTTGLFWPPFAVAVAGGVLLSSTLAFLFTPAFFFLTYASAKRRKVVRDQVDMTQDETAKDDADLSELERLRALYPLHPSVNAQF